MLEAMKNELAIALIELTRIYKDFVFTALMLNCALVEGYGVN